MNGKKYILIPVLVLVLVATSGVSAQAGIFGKSKKNSQEKELKAWRYDRLPTMNFASGTMSRSTFSGWEMDGAQIHFKKDCAVVGSDGEPVRLSEGDQVVVMGPRVGNTIIAWQIRVLDAGFRFPASDSQNKVEWSDVDPTVGVGSGPE